MRAICRIEGCTKDAQWHDLAELCCYRHAPDEYKSYMRAKAKTRALPKRKSCAIEGCTTLAQRFKGANGRCCKHQKVAA